jgi:hypothetical protein
MPVGAPSFSRTNSISSLHSLTPTVTNGGGFNFQPSAEWVCTSIFLQSYHRLIIPQIESWQSELPLHTILTLITELAPQVPTPDTTGGTTEDVSSALAAIRRAQVGSIETSAIRVHLFEWSPLSLGWYESLLWGFIFTSEMLVSKGTAGVWNGTAVKLFRVQEMAAQTPTLLAPRGAVDAVGSTIVNRIGSLNLRGTQPATGGRPAANGAQSVRDV